MRPRCAHWRRRQHACAVAPRRAKYQVRHATVIFSLVLITSHVVALPLTACLVVETAGTYPWIRVASAPKGRHAGLGGSRTATLCCRRLRRHPCATIGGPAVSKASKTNCDCVLFFFNTTLCGMHVITLFTACFGQAAANLEQYKLLQRVWNHNHNIIRGTVARTT